MGRRIAHPRAGREPGVTILEALLAVTLLGICVPPVLRFFTQAAADSIAPERQTAAYFLAVEGMEEVLADRHSPGRGYAYLRPDHYPRASLEGGYTRTVELTEVSPEDLQTPRAGSGCLLVTVTVDCASPAVSHRVSCLVCDQP